VSFREASCPAQSSPWTAQTCPYCLTVGSNVKFLGGTWSAPGNRSGGALPHAGAQEIQAEIVRVAESVPAILGSLGILR
jgi:hypothetical protein